MNKFSILASILTLIFGFTFYGEKVELNILGTSYLVAAEVICFGLWLMFTLIFWSIRMKKFLSGNEA
ncbi:hypothetical protein ML462_03190 [Gramella lutea]|uniref:Uncharacterized protein n=1 Tax=Christiangramia lutea TaxID=1607951 RepID=A0A9X1V0R0_9FLAO|nr:hypothetical protein [Christiangramia lutea]MCH4822167.1 hypothetical protein [Christiangramia lutea]